MLPDYYDRLDVDPSASQEEIRRAYRRLARETHPDRNPGDEEAEERFRRVKEAYDVLGSPVERAKYDRKRKLGPAGGGGPPQAVTAASVGDTGCVTYYLPRVAVGLLAVVAFFIVDAFDVWRADDPQMLWTAVLLVSAVVGGLSVFLLRLSPDTDPDYAVRLSVDDVRAWNEQRMVLRLPWQAVDAVEFDDETGVLGLTTRAEAAGGVQPSPPVLPRVESDGDRVHLALHLGGTDVSRPALRRVLEYVEMRDGG